MIDWVEFATIASLASSVTLLYLNFGRSREDLRSAEYLC